MSCRFSFRATIASAIPAFALLLAACQPLPQPFQPDNGHKAGNPLLDLPDGAGILVRPVQGLPAESAALISDELAAALVKHNIPAFTASGNRQNAVLSGRVVNDAAAVLLRQDLIRWQLHPPGESTYADTERSITMQVDVARLEAGDIGEIRRTADRVVVAIAPLVQNPAERDRTADRKKRSLHVWDVAGAPPDAGAVLKAEMEAALRRGALRVSAQMQEDSIVLAGSVSLSNAAPGNRQITVDWALLRRDGVELGKLTQKNAVSIEALESGWPEIARNIAIAAAPGIRQLLNKVPEKVADDTATR